jgi:hypothetical protein
MTQTTYAPSPQRTKRRSPPRAPERSATTDHRSSAVVRTEPPRTVFGRTEPTKREIRERAYYIYLARGGVNGDPVSDWLQAERELREELRAAPGGRRF